MIVAVDPGPAESAVVALRDAYPIEAGIYANDVARSRLQGLWTDYEGATLAVEMIASYGMAVGKDVFQTCVEIGRFLECWNGPHALVYRKDVKLHLCQSPRAKDPNIRQALIDRYGPGKDAAIGKKANPGPLYGFRSHLWAALAVAVTYHDQQQREAA